MNKQKNKAELKKNIKSSQKQVVNESVDMLTRFENFFTKYAGIFFWIGMGFTILFGLLLFDVKISVGGDDSDYILSAKRFVEGITFPVWHGSFYPIFLGFFYILFGVNIVVFKFVSFFLIVLHLYFFYKTFEGRISNTVLVLITLFTAINAHILYFASQTYSEALYLFFQSLVIFYFFKLYDELKTEPDNFKKHWKIWAVYGFFMFMASITRNVGYGIVITTLFYFLFNKQIKPALYSLGIFVAYLIPYNLYKILFWGNSSSGFAGQFSLMFFKHPYDQSQGKEDLAGFVSRFFENSNLYLSKHFMVILGLKDTLNIDTSSLVTFIFYALFASIFLWIIYRKNNEMLYVAAYLAVSIGISFITLQVLWDQIRIILIYVPLCLILFGFAMLDLAKVRKSVIFGVVFLGIMIVVLFSSLTRTLSMAKDNQPVLSKNLRGDLYYGFTPDWVHFMKMSDWVGKNIPDSVVVASRKPTISFVYGHGRDFFGLYSLPNKSFETIKKEISKTTGKYIYLRINDESMNTIPGDFHAFLKVNLFTLIIQTEGEVYGAHIVDEKEIPVIDSVLIANKCTYFKSINDLDKYLANSPKQVYGIYPDSLLYFLKKNNVTYILDASIRKYAQQKSQYVVNTIQRYMTFTEVKYPGIFEKVHQVGMDFDEPAYLYKINYPVFFGKDQKN